MKPHISIITLGVSDLARATDFYAKLGFPAKQTDNITFMEMPSVWLALYPLEDLAEDAGVSVARSGFSGVTLSHNVGSEKQVDMVIEEVRSIGAKIVDEPHKREWGGYSGYFQDPDGYLWEVAFNPYSPEIAVEYSEK